LSGAFPGVQILSSRPFAIHRCLAKKGNQDAAVIPLFSTTKRIPWKKDIPRTPRMARWLHERTSEEKENDENSDYGRPIDP
jgi:hypothetical protein